MYAAATACEVEACMRERDWLRAPTALAPRSGSSSAATTGVVAAALDYRVVAALLQGH